MSVERARKWHKTGVRLFLSPEWMGNDEEAKHAFYQSLDAASIDLDNATAEAHRTDWRTRQQVIWADALHRTLLASVAY